MSGGISVRPRSTFERWLWAASAIFLLGGFWLTIHNPDSGMRRAWTDTTSTETAICLAPYDTVLNDAANVPGGEQAANDDAIAARCSALGRTRYRQGLGLMAFGGCGVAAAGVSALWRRLR